MSKVDIMSQEKDEEELAHILLFTVAIQSLVTYPRKRKEGPVGVVLYSAQGPQHCPLLRTHTANVPPSAWTPGGPGVSGTNKLENDEEEPDRWPVIR